MILLLVQLVFLGYGLFCKVGFIFYIEGGVVIVGCILCMGLYFSGYFYVVGRILLVVGGCICSFGMLDLG